MMDASTIKRLAIQCGIDLSFYPGGELYLFCEAIEAEILSKQVQFKTLDHPAELDWDEDRIDTIGQNGNDGLHYK
jgi:hypothetical protein